MRIVFDFLNSGNAGYTTIIPITQYESDNAVHTRQKLMDTRVDVGDLGVAVSLAWWNYALCNVPFIKIEIS